MNKIELIKAVAKQTGISNADAALAVDATLKIIANLPNKYDSVIQTELYTFELEDDLYQTIEADTGNLGPSVSDEGTDDPGPSFRNSN